MRWTTLAAAALSTLVLAAPAAAQAPTRLHVAATGIAHTAELDAIRDGLRDGLIDAGYLPGGSLRFDYVTADGDPARAAAIARDLAARSPDAIVAISTPSARAVANTDTSVPRVLVAVDDSLHGLVRDAPVVLLTYAAPADDQAALVAEIAPDARVVAVPFDPVVAGTLPAVHFAAAAEAEGLGVVLLQLAADTDVAAALDADRKRADALFLPAGQADTPLMEALVALAEERQLPLIAGDADAVAHGAVAAVIRDPYATGREAAARLLALLAGDPGPRVAPARAGRLIVNPLAAERQGTPLSDALIDRAAVVVE